MTAAIFLLVSVFSASLAFAQLDVTAKDSNG